MIRRPGSGRVARRDCGELRIRGTGRLAALGQVDFDRRPILVFCETTRACLLVTFHLASVLAITLAIVAA